MGMTEMLIIGVIALVVVGPKRLPGIARSMGKGLKEFKKATNDFKTTVKEELKENTGDEMKDLSSMASEMKRKTRGPKNIEDFLETAADTLEASDKKDDKSEDRKEET